MAAANGVVYTAWTGVTSQGNQDIYFSSFPLATPPQALPDRFYPNTTQAQATDLGSVTVQQVVPGLQLLPGSGSEWFQLTAGASGVLVASVAASGPTTGLHIQVTDASGNVLPSVETDVLDASGAVVGQQLTLASTSGAIYYLHVFAVSDAGVSYSLSVSALTADLGPRSKAVFPAACRRAARTCIASRRR